MGCTAVIGIGIGLALCAGASGGVTITPVGPAGPSHYPVALNNQGDVLFRVWTWWEPTYDEDKPAEQAEVIRADGTAIRIDDREWYDIYASALGPNGEFVVGLGWLDYENELPGGGVPVQFEYEMVEPDGARKRVGSLGVYDFIHAVAPDGRVLGMAWDDPSRPYEGSVKPFAWDEATGVTPLQLPAGTQTGVAFYGARDGGYVGHASDGTYDGYAAYTWWNADGTVASTLDLDLVLAVGMEHFAQAGVLADGTLVGHDFDGNFGGTTVLTISPSGEIATIPMDVGIEVDFTDVNADGLIVGRRFYQGPEYITADWMIWNLDGIGFPLDRFLPNDEGRYVSYVFDINDRGDVLVETSLPNDWEHRQTYLITGLPAPGAASLGALGLAWAGIRRRR